MKKKVTMIAVLAIMIAIVSLGSLAFFTASRTAANVIRTGSIAIQLNDKTAEGTDFVSADGVMPGDAVSKVVSVTNIGENAAWVRIKLTNTAPEGLSFDDITLDIDSAKWTRQGDWYYCNASVEPGATTSNLFTTVTFSEHLTNAYQSKTFNIDVIAEAVQTANNGASALAAAGWPTP